METPEFFLDYMSAVNDAKAFDHLEQLSREFLVKLSEIDENKTISEGAAFEYKLLTGRHKESNAQRKRMDLEQEYKQKAMETAQPHIDTKTFEELAEKHTPKSDKNNPITKAQSKAVAMLKEKQPSFSSTFVNSFKYNQRKDSLEPKALELDKDFEPNKD